MLKIKNIQTFYGNIQALKDISIDIAEGEIITLIGANGAGKSTTLMSLSGVVPVRSGTIEFQGKDITNKNPDEIVAMGISQVPEGRRIFPQLTVQENLDMGSFLRKDKALIKQDQEYMFELFPRLAVLSTVVR
jgi:branched-chain amino acid transport system ATP-binding protein